MHGGGADIMEGGDAAATVASEHGKHGTTSMLATTMNPPRARRRPCARRASGRHQEICRDHDRTITKAIRGRR
ncbi:MAG: unnamed protein product, partial [Candidatus Burkholderia crenata]